MESPEEEIVLSTEQQEALQLMLDGQNVFLTGKAGTGKTTVIHKFKEQCKKSVVCLASTGIAAINIGGSTVHRFLGLPTTVLTPEWADKILSKLGARWDILQYADVILVDEVSMLRSDVLFAMDYILRGVGNKLLPFGGRQIILCGDMSQLPPVVNDENIGMYLNHRHESEYVFCTDTWSDAELVIVDLQETFRQNDNKLLSIANAIRSGKADRSIKTDSNVTYLDVLNKHCCQPINALSDDTIVMCAHKRTAMNINTREVDKLEDEGMISYGRVEGDFPANEKMTSSRLIIKKECRIILLANHYDETGTVYVNGSTGVVIGYEDHDGKVQVRVKLDNGRRVTVKPHTWKSYNYILGHNGKGDICLTEDAAGTYTQLPIIPAYAMTIHKAQGLTIEAPVCIILGKGPCFASGMLYTALTRCRRLEQITLSRPVTGLDCLISREVLDFYNAMDMNG